MRYILTLSLLLSLAQAGFAQLSGSLSGTLGPGEYTVIGDIGVESGDTLRILPRTTFNFLGRHSFGILGTLLAEGTESDSIIFTTDTIANPDRWPGLRFMNSSSSGSRLAYCLIEHGQAYNGGGVHCRESSSPIFMHCTILHNSADANGGGIYCYDAFPSFTNCIISGNSAGSGGGVHCYDASPTFENCTFIGNTARFGGGGVCVWYYSSSTFENCTISNNSAQNGGGIWCEDSANFINCRIYGNSGTGVYCNYAMGTFVNCAVWGNAGAAVVCWGSTLSFFHCSLVGNGGGVFCANCSTPTLNSTIIAFSQGPGIYFTSYTSASQIEHCDFFDNRDGDLVYESNDSAGPPGIGIVDSVNANGEACDVYSNIFLNPHFVDYASYNLHLTDSSWCLGAGDPANPPPTDIEGNPRPNPPGSRPDIGAYESEHATPPEGLCGALRGTLGPGTFHVTCTISVSAGDTLELLPGTIFTFEGPFAFEIEGTLFAEGAESDSIIFTTDTLTILNRWRGLRFLGSGSSTSRLAYCVVENGRASDTAPHDKGGGLYCDHSSPTLTNCTIIGNAADNDGGGVYCIFSSPAFTNCTITGNSANRGGGLGCTRSLPNLAHCSIIDNVATNDGGGVVCDSSSANFISCIVSGNTASDGGGVCCLDNSSPTFENSTITGNVATGFGGGISCLQNSSPTFSYCTIRANSAISAWACGGGVYCSYSSPVLTHCTITENLAGRDGGGVGCQSSPSSLFTHCIIFANSAGGNGGGVDCRASTAPQFTHCTIAANSAGGDGGGMYCHTSSPILTSSIVAFSEGTGIYFSASPHCQLAYCDIFGNSGGAIDGLGIPDSLGDMDTTNANGDSCDAYYNIFLDPMFLSSDDFHLQANSPCIDAGDPNLPFDPDSTIADIGAFYYHQSATEPLVVLLPNTFALYPNWPNPFNSTTMIRYDVPTAGKVSLTVFNLLGQRVATLFDQRHLAGTYTISWDASNLPSGLYLCRMDAAGFAQTRKLLLVK